MAVPAHHNDVIDENREVPVNVLTLRNISDNVLGNRFVYRQATEPHLAGGGRHKAHDRFEYRRFAAAVDTHERADCSWPQFKRGITNGCETVRIGYA